MVELGTRTEQVSVCAYDHRKGLLCVRDIHERDSGILTLGDLGPAEPQKKRAWYMYQPHPEEWESLQQNNNGDDQ